MTGVNVGQITLAANAIRMLSAETVERANSGHPGAPMGMAESLATLYLGGHLRYDPTRPNWINRDRFFLSNGHASAGLYVTLHLAGYAITLDDLRKFRQLGSITPGHPEVGLTQGVEATTGPLGQGIANAVGAAIAGKLYAATYNTHDHAPFDFKVWVSLGDGCMMEGISHEACALAGHLRLNNLIALYDANGISIDGSTDLAHTEDVRMRFQGYGWVVRTVDGHDIESLDQAYRAARAETSQPTLIIQRTKIGMGAPEKCGSAESHGAPLGPKELAGLRNGLQWSAEAFDVPGAVRESFSGRAEEAAAAYGTWEREYLAWRAANEALATQLDNQLRGDVPTNIRELLLAALPSPASVATRKLGGIVLNELAKHVPWLVGGSADLNPSVMTYLTALGEFQRGSHSGRNIRFGVREHAMLSICNGLALSGWLPFGSTFLIFTSYALPAIRLAALSKIRIIVIGTHDSYAVGEDGPNHQPIEQLATLRLIPNVQVWRPADGVEVALAFEAALQHQGPTVIALTRQNLPPIVRQRGAESQIAYGASIVYGEGFPEVTFVATGSEVPLAIEAGKLLAPTHGVNVVSMPCVDRFRALDVLERRRLIPPGGKTVVIEAGTTSGWRDVVNGTEETTLVIGMDGFGASAPANHLAEHFGFTPEKVAARVRAYFAL